MAGTLFHRVAACLLAAAAMSVFLQTHSAYPKDAEPSTPNLRYAWTPNEPYHVRFKLEVGEGARQTIMEGVTVYTPSTAKAKADDRDSGQASGTAFAVNSEGYLITCAHVVHGGVKIVVRVADKDYPATVVAYLPHKDLAILHIAASKLPTVPLGDSDKVELGQDIRALGYPLSDVLGESIKITRGTVSGILKQGDRNYFQVDASINPGNSGGPLTDNQGRVVGVASAKLADDEASNVGLVIPVNEARDLLKQNKVDYSSQGAATDLAGPELTRRVAPAVALVKVTTGAGGVGTANRHVVRYATLLTSHISGQKEVIRDSPHATARGSITVDDRGDIAGGDSVADRPAVLGGFARFGIEDLPPEGEKKWRAGRLAVISFDHTRIIRPTTPATELPRSYRPGMPRPYGLPAQPETPPPPHSPYSPSIPRRPPYTPRYTPPSRVPRTYGRQEPESSAPKVTVDHVVVPALERSSYHIDLEDATTIKITKVYELISLASDSNSQALGISASGSIIWDKKQHCVRESSLVGTATRGEGSNAVKLPVTLHCETLSNAQWIKYAAEHTSVPAAANTPSPTKPSVVSAGAAKAESTSPRADAHKIAESPSASTPPIPAPTPRRPLPLPRRSGDDLPASNGLDQFRPDE